MHSILIVEDDRANLMLFSRLLTLYGYEIHGAMNAQQALDILANVHPDAILMDLHLPGELDGIDLTRKLKENVNFADIPIIAVTANEVGCLAVRTVSFDGFFQKPVDLQRLKSELITIIA